MRAINDFTYIPGISEIQVNLEAGWQEAIIKHNTWVEKMYLRFCQKNNLTAFPMELNIVGDFLKTICKPRMVNGKKEKNYSKLTVKVCNIKFC